MKTDGDRDHMIICRYIGRRPGSSASFFFDRGVNVINENPPPLSLFLLIRLPSSSFSSSLPKKRLSVVGRKYADDFKACSWAILCLAISSEYHAVL